MEVIADADVASQRYARREQAASAPDYIIHDDHVLDSEADEPHAAVATFRRAASLRSATAIAIEARS